MAKKMSLEAQISLFSGPMQRLLRDYESRIPAIVQEHAPVEHKHVTRAFKREAYFDDRGQEQKMEPFGDKWAKEKKRRKWKRQRGRANDRLMRAVFNPLVIRKTKRGWRFDLSRVDRVVRRYTARNRPNSFVGRKAPGLMNMKEGWRERHMRAIRKGMKPHIKAVLGSAAVFEDDDRRVKIVLELVNAKQLQRRRQFGAPKKVFR